jgi:hypothetical protein
MSESKSKSLCEFPRGKYRKRPVVIEAMQWTGENTADVERFVGVLPGSLDVGGRAVGAPWMLIPTLEGEMEARPGDVIIRGVAGEFYPCKPGIFGQTYEAVDVRT